MKLRKDGYVPSILGRVSDVLTIIFLEDEMC